MELLQSIYFRSLKLLREFKLRNSISIYIRIVTHSYVERWICVFYPPVIFSSLSLSAPQRRSEVGNGFFVGLGVVGSRTVLPCPWFSALLPQRALTGRLDFGNEVDAADTSACLPVMKISSFAHGGLLFSLTCTNCPNGRLCELPCGVTGRILTGRDLEEAGGRGSSGSLLESNQAEARASKDVGRSSGFLVSSD
mmetsp:Transcript_97743/g.174131  ORF Transcript_97743/g.174131 Transcript_97743/m.174131 type:complete len:195 (-) Transcript_97743:1645-2229(-)